MKLSPVFIDDVSVPRGGGADECFLQKPDLQGTGMVGMRCELAGPF